jgi:oligopeptidase A
MFRFLLAILILIVVHAFINNKSNIKRNDIYRLNMNSNTLLKNDHLPEFSRFDNNQVEDDVKLILNNLEKDFSDLEKKIESEKDVNNLYNLAIEEMERIGYPLEFGWGMISHLHSVKNNDGLREVYQKMQPEVIKLSNKMSQSEILYNALKKLSEAKILSDERQRIVDLTKNSMFLSGIGLNQEDTKKFNDNNLKLAAASTKFSNNALDSVKEFKLYILDDENMNQLPKSALELYSQQAKDKYPESTPERGPWKVTLDIPSYLPMMLHYPESGLREKLYKEYVTKASSGNTNNIPVIEEILKLKKEKANILNFNNYAELSLSKKMASSVKQIEELLNMLADKSKPLAVKDLKAVTDLARQRSNTLSKN